MFLTNLALLAANLCVAAWWASRTWGTNPLFLTVAATLVAALLAAISPDIRNMLFVRRVSFALAGALAVQLIALVAVSRPESEITGGPGPTLASSPGVTARMVEATLFVSPPEARGAEVFIDGAFVGRAPVAVSVEEGVHLITLRKPGFEILHDKVAVAGGEVIHVEMEAKQ